MFHALIKWKDGAVDKRRFVLEKMPELEPDEFITELTEIIKGLIRQGAFVGRNLDDVLSIHIIENSGN